MTKYNAIISWNGDHPCGQIDTHAWKHHLNENYIRFLTVVCEYNCRTHLINLLILVEGIRRSNLLVLIPKSLDRRQSLSYWTCLATWFTKYSSTRSSASYFPFFLTEAIVSCKTIIYCQTSIRLFCFSVIQGFLFILFLLRCMWAKIQVTSSKREVPAIGTYQLVPSTANYRWTVSVVLISVTPGAYEIRNSCFQSPPRPPQGIRNQFQPPPPCDG